MSFGQGGPQWGQGGPGGHEPRTPDWAALAEASETRTRKRRWLMIGGGAVATAVVAALVATVVVSANGEDRAGDKPPTQLPTTADLPEDTTEPAPSFSEVAPPPPPDPKDYISSAKKDRAPLSKDGLYPGTKLTVGERVYKKGKTGRAKNCASVTQGALGGVLNSSGCDQVIRATYSRGDVAVTVGVAVFENANAATRAKDRADGNIASLAGDGVPTFCRTKFCRSTANSYGRYAYFTIGGFTNGKNVTKSDSGVYTAGDDIAEFTFRQIHRRGEAQASAAAAGQ